jgi:hypothetical protein
MAHGGLQLSQTQKKKKESPSKNSSFILNIHKSNNLKFSINE